MFVINAYNCYLIIKIKYARYKCACGSAALDTKHNDDYYTTTAVSTVGFLLKIFYSYKDRSARRFRRRLHKRTCLCVCVMCLKCNTISVVYWPICVRTVSGHLSLGRKRVLDSVRQRRKIAAHNSNNNVRIHLWVVMMLITDSTAGTLYTIYTYGIKVECSKIHNSWSPCARAHRIFNSLR